MDKYFEKYRFKFLIVFSIMVLSVILLTIVFWNTFRGNKEPGVAIILLLIISLASAGGIFSFYRKATSEDELEEYIKGHITKSRNELLESFQGEKSDENEEEKSDEDFQKSLQELIPKGNFKKYDSFTKGYLSNLAERFELITGLAYLQQADGKYSLLIGYGLPDKFDVSEFNEGEGLCGQVAKSKRSITINEIPEEYFKTESGLGESAPKALFVSPVLIEGKASLIFELGFFKKLDQHAQNTIRLANELFAEKFKELINT